MQIANKGPSLAALRRCVGTKQKVTFGDGGDAVDVEVEALCVVGPGVAPIVIPRGSMTPRGNVWFVGGSVTTGTLPALAGFNAAGKFQCAAMVVDPDIVSTRLSAASKLGDAFTEMLQEHFAAILEG